MPASNSEARVKAHFDNIETYLTSNKGITIRQETINYFLKDQSFTNLLDIACGNGMISIPLLGEGIRLTLVDISDKMIEVAESNIPQQWKEQVSAITGSITDIDLESDNFDVVFCLGLLAHVPDPFKTIEKAVRLVRPGGHLIVQNTDASHPYSRLVVLPFDWLKGRLGFASYRLNRISGKRLQEIIGKHGFRLEHSYSYIVSYPLINRLLRGPRMYRLIRNVFGTADRKRRQWLGNDDIMHFVRTGERVP